ncbi:MAG: nucleoside-diphosphate kinase [Vagococcus sp.]
MNKQSLVIIKPDGVERKLVGEIITRFEKKGLMIKQMKLEMMTKEQAIEHYSHLKDLPFFGNIVTYMTSGPVVYLELEGENAIELIRNMIGATNPLEATSGSIRGDFALSVSQNVVHASDSVEAAEIEINRFFQ